MQLKAALLALQRSLPTDVAELRHVREHLVAARQSSFGIEDRVVVRGRLRQTGEQRRLLQSQLPDRFVEVDPRRGQHPDRGRAVDRPVGGGVEVFAEDVLLGMLLFVLQRQLRLLDLALQVALRIGDAEVAHQLHRDRRAALHDLARLEVGDQRPQAALVVDPVVLEEALILDRHRRVLEADRDAVPRHRGACLVGGDVAESAAVAGIEDRVAPLVDRPAVRKRRRAGRHVQNPGGDADPDHGRHAEQADADEEHLALAASTAPVTSSIALRHARKGTSAPTPHSLHVAFSRRCRGARPIAPAVR